MLLVTGGAGFIGSHLVDALLQRNFRVRILDNLSTGKKENLEEISGKRLGSLRPKAKMQIVPLREELEFYFGDITDLGACRKACEGAEYVLHQAALGSVQRSVEDPVSSHRTNATGTLNMLQAAKDADVKRFLYASSSSVYGDVSSDNEEPIPKKEDLSPNPQSPYAATKLMGEVYCRIFSRLYGLETVSLRYFNVFGPRQDPKSIYSAVIPRFVTSLLQGEHPCIFGDGNQSRDFTYVENVVQANLLALKRPGISGDVFNIACGKQISVNALLSSLQEVCRQRTHARYEKPRVGEVRHSLASIDSARLRLGYEAKIELPEGLSRTWQWFLKRGF
jgi:nucleoside-diphosphate-sugar epimerase